MNGNVIVIAGYGPGIGNGVAEKFGKLGYKVALISRTQSKLDEAVKALAAKNITSKAFTADLSDPEQAKTTITHILKTFGSIAIILWNPYGPFSGLLTATSDNLISNFNLSNTSLIISVQTALEDLKTNKGAVLVTGGGLANDDDGTVGVAVGFGASSVVVAKAASRKTVRLLDETVKTMGVFVGEVAVNATVKGTFFDMDGTARLTAEEVAEAFFRLEKERNVVFASVM
ncbi:hypothetical protein HDU97_007843 [Phlyctochytrium planicorne]|nr:hypothetical protein HDU97_007843 [Phlyctochytrium planicorne]